jgi:peptide-methionine (S)-S-oxide reductase
MIVSILAAMTLAGPAPRPATAMPVRPAMPSLATRRDTAVFAGGCFWGIQAVFERIKGVTATTAGFAGGTIPHPSYELVSTGTTGYAESVQVIYDPSQVTYDTLLKVFFAVALDPTELNYQGPDHGTQYRSALFYRNAAQQAAARAYIAELTRAHAYGRPIVTEVTPLKTFYPAESYHQHFYDKNPDYGYIVYNDKPKVEQLKQRFPQLYRAVDVD